MICNWCCRSLDHSNDITSFEFYDYHYKCQQEYAHAPKVEKEHGKGSFPVTIVYPCGCNMRLIGGRGGIYLDYDHGYEPMTQGEDAIDLCEEHHQKLLVKPT